MADLTPRHHRGRSAHRQSAQVVVCPGAAPAVGVEDRAVQGEAVAGVGGLGVVEQDQVQPVTPELLVVVRVGGGQDQGDEGLRLAGGAVGGSVAPLRAGGGSMSSRLRDRPAPVLARRGLRCYGRFPPSQLPGNRGDGQAAGANAVMASTRLAGASSGIR